MSLERRIALFTSALVLGLLVCICVIVGGTILRFEGARLARDLKATEALSAQLEAERFRALEAEARLLADLPQLKALIATRDGATITDALDGFREMIGADFLAAADGAGTVYGLKDRESEVAFVKRASEQGQMVHGYVASGERLEQLVVAPIRIGAGTSGALVAGYGFGREILGRLRTMTRSEFAVRGAGGRIIERTNGAEEALKPGVGTLDAEPSVHGDFILASSVLSGPDGTPAGELIAIRPLSEGMHMASRLRANVIGISAIFCFLGISLSFLFARSISKPLRTLAETLRRTDPADTEALSRLVESSEGVGADHDVQSVLTSFGAMVNALSAERERLNEGIAMRTQDLQRELGITQARNQKLIEANGNLRKILDQEDAA